MTDNVHARRPRTLLAALLAGTALLLAACGGGSFEDKAATTTTTQDAEQDTGGSGSDDTFSAESIALGEEILSQFDIDGTEVDELETGCLGTALIDALGESDAQDLLTTDTPTSEQLEATGAAFDACISGTTLAGALTALFFDELPGSPTPDQSVVSCVAGEIDGTTGQLIVGLVDASDTGGLPTEFLDTLDVCVPDEVVADLFVEELSSDGTFDTVQATCIAEAIAPQLSISTLAAAGQADGLPADVQALIEEATVACLAAG
jgi:hypothetical protein